MRMSGNIFRILFLYRYLLYLHKIDYLMRVLFLVPYPPGVAASQRFRFEQYLHLLSSKGISYKISPFIDISVWNILYRPGHFPKKFLGILRGAIKRFLQLFTAGSYDYIFIHRETAPLGPPIIEWILIKIFRKKVIYDFDDAIWIPNSSEHNELYSFFKWNSNVKFLCRNAYKVSCGNEYLCDFARQYNSNVVYNPTTIDTENLHNKVKEHGDGKFVIGWTGSHSTMQYLDEVFFVLKELEKTHVFEVHIISDEHPKFELTSLKFVKWNKDSEIDDILRFNIGLMPLRNDKWANGKCGFKALQYMALGIPALVSPIGVNSKIVSHGKNGFICSSPEEWKQYIIELMNNPTLLKEMGSKTREKIETSYSVFSNSANFLHLFT